MNTTTEKNYVFEGPKIDRVFVGANSVKDAADKLLEMIVASRISVHHITMEGSIVFIFRDEKEKELWETATIDEMPVFDFPESAK